MGRKATFVKSRYQDFKNKNAQRKQRSDDMRQQRRGGVSDADKNRLVQKIIASRPLPSKDQQELLFSQFVQSCRLPGAPSEDLCRLIRSYDTQKEDSTAAAVSSSPAPKQTPSKKGKAAVEAAHDSFAEVAALAKTLLDLPNTDSTAASEDDVTTATTLADIVCNESGSRVVAALLQVLSHSLSDSPSAKVGQSLQEHVLSFFEVDVRRLEHFVASRLIGVLCEHGSKATRVRVAELLKKQVAAADDRLEMLKSFLTERHTSAMLLRLLSTEDVGAGVRTWLSTELHITPAAAAASPASKSKKRPREEESTTMSDSDREALLQSFIADPHASTVLFALISDENRAQLFELLTFSKLLSSKRGNRMLNILMTPTTAGTPAPWASAMLDALLMRQTSEEVSVILNDMSSDSTGNFVVQTILKLLPLVPTAENCLTYGLRVIDLMLPGLQAMTRHSIAVHVVLALIESFAKCAELHPAKMTPPFHQIVKSILRPETVLDLVRDRSGSLVIRKLIDVFASASGTTKSRADSKLLLEMLEQHMSGLMYDPMGNLVVQHLIQSEGASGAHHFYLKFVKKEDVLAMAQHPSAAHVLCALLDKGDVQTCTDLCGALKPHVITIAKHLNGRFVCERMLAANRDICAIVMRSFQHLALQKGTQHLLLKLVETLDATKRQTFFLNVVVPQFVTLATNATASIVIQKMLQTSKEFLAVAQEFVKKQPPAVLRDLQQNFHGGFVARILLSA